MCHSHPVLAQQVSATNCGELSAAFFSTSVRFLSFKEQFSGRIERGLSSIPQRVLPTDSRYHRQGEGERERERERERGRERERKREREREKEREREREREKGDWKNHILRT